MKSKLAVVLWMIGFAPFNLRAAPLFTSGTIGGETDMLAIQLYPSNGALAGGRGGLVSWGFLINWTATNNYISFTGSSLGSVVSPETNSSLLAGYTDFIGASSGPNGIALGTGTWQQRFGGGGSGVGSYAITSNPNLAIPGALDTGQITFNFDVYNGNPLSGGAYLASYAYYGPTTQFSVQVIPEPGTLSLLAIGMVFLLGLRLRAVALA